MNFEQLASELNETLKIVSELEQKRLPVLLNEPSNMILHEQRMNYIDMRLGQISAKLKRLTDGQFRRPQ